MVARALHTSQFAVALFVLQAYGAVVLYELQAYGQCSFSVTTLDDCRIAAQELKLSDTSAELQDQSGVNYHPPYCYLEGSSLKFNANGDNTGYCSSDDTCLCRDWWTELDCDKKPQTANLARCATQPIFPVLDGLWATDDFSSDAWNEWIYNADSPLSLFKRATSPSRYSVTFNGDVARTGAATFTATVTGGPALECEVQAGASEIRRLLPCSYLGSTQVLFSRLDVITDFEFAAFVEKPSGADCGIVMDEYFRGYIIRSIVPGGFVEKWNAAIGQIVRRQIQKGDLIVKVNDATSVASMLAETRQSNILVTLRRIRRVPALRKGDHVKVRQGTGLEDEGTVLPIIAFNPDAKYPYTLNNSVQYGVDDFMEVVVKTTTTTTTTTSTTTSTVKNTTKQCSTAALLQLRGLQCCTASLHHCCNDTTAALQPQCSTASLHHCCNETTAAALQLHCCSFVDSAPPAAVLSFLSVMTLTTFHVM